MHHDPFVEINESDVDSDYSDYYDDTHYYIDLSELSDKQYKILKDTIKDVDEKGYDDIDL